MGHKKANATAGNRGSAENVHSSNLVAPILPCQPALCKLTCTCASCWKNFPAEQTIIRCGSFWLCLDCDDKMKSYHAAHNTVAAWAVIGRIMQWVNGGAE